MAAEPRSTLPPAGRPGSLIWQQKLDGFRVIAFVRAGRLYLQSRTGADLTGHFPELQEAAAAIGEDLVLDGELVVLQGGRLDFAALQQRARLATFRARSAGRTSPAHIVAFDVLEAGGQELLARPYRERWDRLRRLFAAGTLSGRWALVGSALDRQEASDRSINIRWGEHTVTVLERGEELSLCRHEASGRELEILTAYLDQQDGVTKCEDSTDYFLPVEPGEKLHVVRRVSGRTLVKKDGVTGWYRGRLQP